MVSSLLEADPRDKAQGLGMEFLTHKAHRVHLEVDSALTQMVEELRQVRFRINMYIQ